MFSSVADVPELSGGSAPIATVASQTPHVSANTASLAVQFSFMSSVLIDEIRLKTTELIRLTLADLFRGSRSEYR